MPSNLASEIFGRLKELRQEQETKDYEKQRSLVGLYADLGKQVDPNSMGTYLEGFEKLMFPSSVTPKGFDKKGFMNFVRSFSGMPSDDFGTRLGSEFRGLTSKFVGPRQAKMARGKAITPQISQALGGGLFTPPPQDLDQAAGLEGKVVLRDPQEETLERLQTQYGLQHQAKLNELATKEELMRERQKINDERDFANRFELAQLGSTLKARQGIFTEAMKVAQLSGRRYPVDNDYDVAIQNISRRDNLNEDVLRERAGYLGAKAAEARKVASGEVLGIGERQERQFAQGQYEIARKTHGDWLQARTKAKEIIPVIKSAEQSLNQMVSGSGGRFDPGTRSFIFPDPKQEPTRQELRAQQDYLKLIQEETGLKADLVSKYRSLKGMSSYVQSIGQTEWDDIELKSAPAPSEGVRRQGAQRPQVPSRPVPKAGLGATRGKSMDDYMQVANPGQYRIGVTYTNPNGFKMKVTNKDGNVIYYKIVK